MLQSINMNHSKSILLYQDDPLSGWVLKSIVLIVPSVLLAASLYLWSSGDGSGSLVLLVEGILLGFILWTIFPRKYQVFEDHVGILLGGFFTVKIGFNQIETIEVTTKNSFTLNLVTSPARTYVRIVKKKGLSIAITPRNNDSFVENANRAWQQWKKNNS